MSKKEISLETIKEDYKELQKKYSLPSFEELDEDFQIEKTTEVETDHLLREMRKIIAEKLYNYLRFVETLLNPANAPMFIFSLVKSIGEDEKKELGEIYKKLATSEVKLIETDLVHSEEKEALFIKESYKLWQGIKKDLLKIIGHIKSNWDNKPEGKSKGYFG
tara:strand:- start:717 stop:1205 length:489 start_codon:yes stop_codon:yes gene_type:complete